MTKKEKPQYVMEEIEELPDLKFICNNENGKFAIFGSRNPERIFAVFRTQGDTMMGSSLILKELNLSTYPNN